MMRCEFDNVERSMPYLGYNRCSRKAVRKVGRRNLCTFHANRADAAQAEQDQRFKEFKQSMGYERSR